MSSRRIIVVGAGHAGVEAAAVCARKGFETMLITSRLDRIAAMSCNPSIGGLAKGHMVREIDILGGLMGRVADQTCIQFKRLNSKKGPAVRGSRAQCDKDLYAATMRALLETIPNLTLFEGEVHSLDVREKKCQGVYLKDGSHIPAASVIITTGTFMNGVLFVGDQKTSGGRIGEAATQGISDQLREWGFDVRRLKTGTPARLHRDSIDWSVTEPQHGDEEFYPFSIYSSAKPLLPQVACYLTHTTQKTHEIIRENLHRSPLYAGLIEGVGPRYCPSIEDKVVRFEHKERHQTFLEPEGLNTDLIYLQGISTSLPQDVQDQFLRTIRGLENVKVARYGYAVEYDFIEPTQINSYLETRSIEGLYLAGQINGTSGYEEAAAQGFLAGVNASLKLEEKEPFLLKRHEAYMGVLVDDLVTKGTLEPYRMFTSRAEYRLLLREDNTHVRLLNYAERLNLHEPAAIDKMREDVAKHHELVKKLEETIIYPNKKANDVLIELQSPVLQKPQSAASIIRRSGLDIHVATQFGVDIHGYPRGTLDSAEIEIKYSGYIHRQNDFIDQMSRIEDERLPMNLDYSSVRGLSMEEVEKLTSVQPVTLGQASRLSGVNPSAIQAISIYLKTRARRPQELQ